MSRPSGRGHPGSPGKTEPRRRRMAPVVGSISTVEGGSRFATQKCPFPVTTSTGSAISAVGTCETSEPSLAEMIATPGGSDSSDAESSRVSATPLRRRRRPRPRPRRLWRLSSSGGASRLTDHVACAGAHRARDPGAGSTLPAVGGGVPARFRALPQPRRASPVCGKRFGLTPGAIEREHQKLERMFAVRIGVDERSSS